MLLRTLLLLIALALASCAGGPENLFVQSRRPRRADRTRGIDPWRSVGGAVNAAATLAEAQGRILVRTLRAGKQGAGPTLEETAVTA